MACNSSQNTPPARRSFVSDIPEDLICPICLNDAIYNTTPCGHSFCVSCIYAHIGNRLRMRAVATCPMCRNPVNCSALHTLNEDLLRRVRELLVRCSGEANGCCKIGILKDIENHEESCEYVRTVCRYKERGCHRWIARKHVNIHGDQCRYNPKIEFCNYSIYGCKMRGISSIINAHMKNCPLRHQEEWIVCATGSRNKCTAIVRRYFLDMHREECLQKLADKNVEQVCGKAGEEGQQETKLYSFSISLESVSANTLPSYQQLKTTLEGFIPNVHSVSRGFYSGEVDAIVKELPLSAYSTLARMGDSQVMRNLSDVGHYLKGIRIIEEINASNNLVIKHM